MSCVPCARMRIDAASGFVHGVRRSVPKAVRTECPDLRGSPQIYPRDNRHGFVVRTHSPNFLPRRFNFSPQGPEIFIPLVTAVTSPADLRCVLKGLTLLLEQSTKYFPACSDRSNARRGSWRVCVVGTVLSSHHPSKNPTWIGLSTVTHCSRMSPTSCKRGDHVGVRV